MKRLIFLIWLIFLIENPAISTFGQEAVYLPVSMGMGGAYTAVSRGVEGLFYNPAGIFQGEDTIIELLFSYYKPFLGLDLYFFDPVNESVKKDNFSDVVFGAVFKTNSNISFGLGYRKYGVSLYKENSIFGAAAYARDLNENVKFSTGLKLRMNSINLEENQAVRSNPLLSGSNFTKNDMNVDLGFLLLKKFQEQFRFACGLNFQNLLSPKIGIKDNTIDSRRRFDIGILFEHWDEYNNRSNIKFSFDLVRHYAKIDGKQLDFSMGAEKLFSIANIPLYLRTGTNLQTITAFGLGIELKINNSVFVTDFCYESFMKDIGNYTWGNMLMSFKLKF